MEITSNRYDNKKNKIDDIDVDYDDVVIMIFMIYVILLGP